MRFGRGVRISQEFTFPVRKSVIRENFEEFANLSCHFGDLSSSFRFDSRCFDRPHLDGIVVASLSFSRARTAMLVFYPIDAGSYSFAARAEFGSEVITKLRNWLGDQFRKPDTALLGYEQVIVIWNGIKHGYEQVKFL